MTAFAWIAAAGYIVIGLIVAAVIARYTDAFHPEPRADTSGGARAVVTVLVWPVAAIYVAGPALARYGREQRARQEAERQALEAEVAKLDRELLARRHRDGRGR